MAWEEEHRHKPQVVVSCNLVSVSVNFVERFYNFGRRPGFRENNLEVGARSTTATSGLRHRMS